MRRKFDTNPRAWLVGILANGLEALLRYPYFRSPLVR